MSELSLEKRFPPHALSLLDAKGIDVLRRIGIDAVREVVFDVMSGINIRNSTEALTRRRVSLLNLAIVDLFVKGETTQAEFAKRLPYLATENLSKGGLTRAERWLSLWALGLTDKGFQNILRDKVEDLERYRDEYVQICEDVVTECVSHWGELSGEIRSTSGEASVSDLFLVYLMNMIGSQTLTIRGSDKSLNGKLFEKLILGSLLHVLDFTYVPEDKPGRLENVFWLSSRGSGRESDATLLLHPGQAIRFDIGFIGRGNPEISLDKVSRFEREIKVSGTRFYVATIVVVDRIGPGSRIEDLAKGIDGYIVQMSEGYWPQKVARILAREFSYESSLALATETEIHDLLNKRLATAPLETWVGLEP